MPSTGASPSSCSIGQSPRAAASQSPGSSTPAFADVGRQIVKAVLEADRNFKPAEPGRIVFLHHRSDDPYLERSFESLLGPCKAAGKPMEMLEFDGDAEQGMAVLRKSLEADPKIDILLADDAVGVFVGFRIHFDWIESGRRQFVLAGYTSNDYRDRHVSRAHLRHRRSLGRILCVEDVPGDPRA